MKRAHPRVRQGHTNGDRSPIFGTPGSRPVPIRTHRRGLD
jgi:hypothetical protein